MKFYTTVEETNIHGAVTTYSQKITVEDSEVRDLLDIALEGNLHEVNGDTIKSELERRGVLEDERE